MTKYNRKNLVKNNNIIMISLKANRKIETMIFINQNLKKRLKQS